MKVFFTFLKGKEMGYNWRYDNENLQMGSDRH